MQISKSQYIRGLQCHKSLWLSKHKPQLKEKPNAQTEAMFNDGYAVGDIAKKLFPNGVEIEFNAKDFDGMANKTSQLIDEGTEVIYEATFNEKNVFAMADILVKSDDGWNIYEVKASTSTKPYHIDDASVQYYGLSNVLKINKVFVVHVNTDYVRQGELDIESLLTIDDVTEAVLSKQDNIKPNLDGMFSMLKSDEPDIGIGMHCSDPHECDFKEHCWRHISTPSVFNLYRLNKDKKFELYNNGAITYDEIPKDYKLNKVQELQIAATKSRDVTINKDVINEFLDSIEYPLSFFDFETFRNVIPRFDNQKPYMQMPFQYSLHIQEEGGELTHIEYLGDENSDPRRELSERMIKDLPKTGSIMAYYMSFEKSRTKELAKLFPDLHDDLMSLVDRFIDLIVPFQKLGYYHPDFNGSFSIKSVLPALFPNNDELDYKQLEIQNGGMAMNTFENLHLNTNQDEVSQIRKDLLAYCHLDTLAMVRLWEKLKEV